MRWKKVMVRSSNFCKYSKWVVFSHVHFTIDAVYKIFMHNPNQDRTIMAFKPYQSEQTLAIASYVHVL